MQHPKMAFFSEIEPSIKSYDAISILSFWDIFFWNTKLTDGFLYSAKGFKARYKSEIFGKITFDLLVKMIKKSQFLPKSQENAISKNDLQKSNSALSQRLCVFYVFAKIQIWKSHWTDGFLKALNQFFFSKIGPLRG